MGQNLKKCGDGATRVPEHGGQVGDGLALLAELEQGVLTGLRAGQLVDPLVNLLPIHLCHGRAHRLRGKNTLLNK